MRTTQQSLAAVGYAPWIIHDIVADPTNVTLAGFVSSGASLTWEAQFTPDDLSTQGARSVGISQSTTVITVTDLGPPGNGGTHGLSVGDYVSIQGSGIAAGVDGEFVVATVVSASQYTVTSGTSQTASSSSAKVVSGRVFSHSVLTAQTSRAVSNYAFPVKASRLHVSVWASGTATLEVLQGSLSS